MCILTLHYVDFKVQCRHIHLHFIYLPIHLMTTQNYTIRYNTVFTLKLLISFNSQVLLIMCTFLPVCLLFVHFNYRRFEVHF